MSSIYLPHGDWYDLQTGLLNKGMTLGLFLMSRWRRVLHELHS